MRFASLGSGSEGNALVAQVGKTCVMLDCGFGLNDAVVRLARLGLTPTQLDGIIVTHEHDDHLGGVSRLAAKFGIPVWLTHGTFQFIEKRGRLGETISVFDSHSKFSVGDIEVSPFPVPHDAMEPVQYVLSDGERRLGVLTDTGCITPHIENMLTACDALVLECNHDLDMLQRGDYPAMLKNRIASRFGHLDNETSSKLLASIDCSRLQHLVAAHLSKKNNTPQLARSALSRAIRCDPAWITVADQQTGFEWKEIS
jgi:phosphoribosyl 1,2-cyclic phosphodiesterase